MASVPLHTLFPPHAASSPDFAGQSQHQHPSVLSLLHERGRTMATARPSGPDPPVRHPHPHVCTHSPTQPMHHWSPGPLSGSNPPHLPVPGPAQVRTVWSRHAPQPAPDPGTPAPPAVPLHGWLHPPQIQISPCFFTARHPLPMKPACLLWAPEAPPTSSLPSPCPDLIPSSGQASRPCTRLCQAVCSA